MSTIHIRSGSEGPRQDPYHFEEITVTRPNGVSVTLHEGLDCFVAVNGKRCQQAAAFPPGATIEQREAMLHGAAASVFESLAGCTVEAARKAYHRLRSRCQSCGCRETRSASGYPGESFTLCARCGHVMDSHMDWSAVE